MDFKRFRNFRIICSFIALLCYILMLVSCILLKFYFAFFVFVFLLIYLCFYYGLIRKIYMTYGIKKQGYVCYYNDYSARAGRSARRGLYDVPISIPQIDIIVKHCDVEKRIITKDYSNKGNMNNEKFLELSSSNKKIYVDVYFIGDKYYVDFDSFKIE